MSAVCEISVNMLIRSVGVVLVCAWLGVTAHQAPLQETVPFEQVERDITDVTSRGE